MVTMDDMNNQPEQEAPPQPQWPQYPWPQQDVYYTAQYPPPPAPPAEPSPPPQQKRPLLALALSLGLVLLISFGLNVLQFNFGQRWQQQIAAQEERALLAESRAGSAESEVMELEEQLGELAEEMAAMQKSASALAAENEALTQRTAALEGMLAKAQAEGATLTPDMAYINIMDYAKMASDFDGVLYHKYGCPRLDMDLYAGMPTQLVASTQMEPCPECH